MNDVQRATILEILNQDRIWSGYALGDLNPKFDAETAWYPVHTEEGAGVLLVFKALDPPIIVTVGAVDAVAQALEEAELPKQVYISTQEEHYPLLAKRYDFSQAVYSMYRMLLKESVVFKTPPSSEIVRLTVDDSEHLRTLYSHGGPHAPDYFDPAQLEEGVFFGIVNQQRRSKAGALLAAGGTHIVDLQESIAAIGNMYTHPKARGRGYGSLVLRAVVAELQRSKIKDIILNVDQKNLTAQRLYQKHGFVIHCPFIEGKGKLFKR